MVFDPRQSIILVGLMRVREHCTFAWRRGQAGGERLVEVRPDHCPPCVAELRGKGFRLITPDGADYPSS